MLFSYAGWLLCLNEVYFKISNSIFLHIYLGPEISSPPRKRCVGRPIKTFTLEQAQNIMAKHHDSNEMVDFYEIQPTIWNLQPIIRVKNPWPTKQNSEAFHPNKKARNTLTLRCKWKLSWNGKSVWFKRVNGSRSGVNGLRSGRCSSNSW